MQTNAIVSGWLAAVWLCLAGPSGATADQTAGGVLDQLQLPTAVTIDSHATGPAISADPIAVPTPTAATAGLAMIGVIVAGRHGRRWARGF